MSYAEKKAARIERLRARAEKKREFANNNDLSLFGEEKSGIPLGQPILVGHHSEKRHRKHLERIENRVRKGYEAADEAERLEERAAAAENRTAIDSDNPEALRLIDEKIAKLEKKIEHAKRINSLLRKHPNIDQAIEFFKKVIDSGAACKTEREEVTFIYEYLSSRRNFYHSDNTRLWYLGTTNANAEIRRLKKRRAELAIVQDSSKFEPFEIHIGDGGPPELIRTIYVELKDGQVQVEFPFKPNEETRKALKTSPLALKWSSYSKRWVRKHTASTAVKWWREELIKVLKGAKP